MLTYRFGSIADWTGGSSFFFATAFPLPPALAGESPNAANDPEKTDAIKVGSKSKILFPLGSLT